MKHARYYWLRLAVGPSDAGAIRFDVARHITMLLLPVADGDGEGEGNGVPEIDSKRSPLHGDSQLGTALLRLSFPDAVLSLQIRSRNRINKVVLQNSLHAVQCRREKGLNSTRRDRGEYELALAAMLLAKVGKAGLQTHHRH